MTAREWQQALFLADHWNASDKLTLNVGLRLERYPLMHRKDTRHRAPGLQHLHRAHRRPR